jgi:hypothetical protein
MKETDDIFFREIMSKSKLEVPSYDFDDKVMGLIKKHLKEKKSISRDIRLSWLFFVFGLAFGIMVTLLFMDSHITFLGVSLNSLTMPFLIVFVIALVTQFDSFKDFYRNMAGY